MTEKERLRARKWKHRLENLQNSTFYRAKRVRIRLRLCKKHKKFMDRVLRKNPETYLWHSAPKVDIEVWLFVEDVLRKQLPYSRSTYNGDIWSTFAHFYKDAKASGVLRKRSI